MPQYDASFIKRLQQNLNKSERRLSNFKEKRKETLQKYVGGHYNDQKSRGDLKAQPLNMIQTTASIYIPMLVMHNPQYRVRTENIGHKGVAWMIEKDLNETVKEMALKTIIEKVTVDSLFFMGICKIGMGHGPKVPLHQIVDVSMFGPEVKDLFSEEIEIPQLFIKRISVDDYIVDPHAKDMSEIQFEGDRYVVPLRLASEWFPEAGLQADMAIHKKSETADISGRQVGGGDEPLYEQVELADIYLPMDGTIVTIAPNQTEDIGALKVAQWNGPEGGPYLKLNYHYVPDQLFPSPPVNLWIDLHDMINTIARRVENQTEREKNIGVYAEEISDKAEELQEAQDGDWVGVNNVDAVSAITLGGAAPQSEAIMQRMLQLFSQQAGNTDLLGGMQARARTATEAQMLSQNSSLRVQYMQDRVEGFAQQIGKHISYLRWYDPFIQRRMSRKVDIAGITQELSTVYSPETKMGEYDEYCLEIIPYSMRGRHPQEYAQTLMNLNNQVILPMLEIAMAQGYHLDVGEYVKMLGEEMGVNNLHWYFRKGEMIAPAQKPGGDHDTMAEQEGGPAGRQAAADRQERGTGLTPEVEQMMTHGG